MCEGEDVPLRNVFARTLVWSMFRSSADEDYLAARWSAKAGIVYTFFWHSQQCIEKYLKGCLLMNGRSISDFGHDLGELLTSVRDFADDLLPLLLCPPKYWIRDRRIVRQPFEPFAEFIDRINTGGHPNSRYRHDGYLHFGDDLHKLDEVCFQIRRLVFPLSIEYSGVFATYKDYIKNSVNHQPHLPFGFLNSGSIDQKQLKYQTIAWRNYSFFEAGALGEGKINAGTSMGMSELELNVHDVNRGSEAVEWLLSKGRFSKAEKAELLSLVSGHATH